MAENRFNASSMKPHGIARNRAAIGVGKKGAAAWDYAPCGCSQQTLCP
jgi:hypothetical protein